MSDSFLGQILFLPSAGRRLIAGLTTGKPGLSFFLSLRGLSSLR
jgi:hypothetical protein